MEDIEILSEEQLATAFVGDAYQEFTKMMRPYQPLSHEELCALLKRYQAGDLKARDKIIYSNWRLVVSIAKRYLPRLKHNDFMDIINVGMMGISRALETYDPEISRFSTYAYPWINQAIQRSLDNSEEEIRKPVWLIDLTNKYKGYLATKQRETGKIPDTKTTCHDLKITAEQLILIKQTLSTENVVSANQKLQDDDKDASELADFIPSEERGYDAVIIEEDEKDIFRVIRSILPNNLYYILYHRYLSENRKTLDEVGWSLGITRERVRQLEVKALKKIKPHFDRGGIKASSLSLTKQKEGKAFKLIRIDPVYPHDIALCLYLQNYLEPFDFYILTQVFLGKYEPVSYINAQKLEISMQELKERCDNYAGLIRAVSNSEDFLEFKRKKLKEHGNGIYRVKFTEEKELDYEGLTAKYSNLSYEEFMAKLSFLPITLSPKEERLVERYFAEEAKISLPHVDIERRVNAILFDYEPRLSHLPVKVLNQVLEDNPDKFTEEQSDFLKAYYFHTLSKEDLDKKYPGGLKVNGPNLLIMKLEYIYYGIYSILTSEVTKEDYLHARKIAPKRFTPQRIYYLDLYFGVNDKPMMITEIAKMHNIDYVVLHDMLSKAKKHIRSVLRGENPNDDIDYEVYRHYLDDNDLELNTVNRQIMHLLIEEGKSYKEISEITGLTIYQISNSVKDTLRKLDFDRYGIDPIFRPDREILKSFFAEPRLGIPPVMAEVVKARYLENLSMEKTAEKLGINYMGITSSLIHFKDAYNSYRAKDYSFTSEDVLKELAKHPSESILSADEAKFLSLLYGVKNKYNKKGTVRTKEEICTLMNISPRSYKKLKKDAEDKMRQAKSGLVIPADLVIPRGELSKILDDPHLPISDKERDIICSLMGLKGYSYKTKNELAKEMGELVNSVDRRYKRALLSIMKYQAKEIEGKICYEIDIVPLLKYFSLSDRQFIEDMYLNNLSAEKMAKKYGFTVESMRQNRVRIKNNLYALMTNPKSPRFDFDYYLKEGDNPDLPFYGNRAVAKKAFDLLFGMKDNKRVPATSILDVLGLDCGTTAVLRLIQNYMLSICKYRDGFNHALAITNEDIRQYYEEHKDEMDEKQLKAYHTHFTKVMARKNNYTISCTTYNRTILFDQLKLRHPNYFQLDKTTPEEIKVILSKYGKQMSGPLRDCLMHHYNLRPRDFLSGKDKHHIYRIFNKVDMLERERKAQSRKRGPQKRPV